MANMPGPISMQFVAPLFAVATLVVVVLVFVAQISHSFVAISKLTLANNTPPPLFAFANFTSVYDRREAAFNEGY